MIGRVRLETLESGACVLLLWLLLVELVVRCLVVTGEKDVRNMRVCW
mgnify:CR=1 FL=1